MSNSDPALMTEVEASQLNSMQLAFIGDTVHDLLVRTELMYSGQKVNDMHIAASQRVNAAAQARALHSILPLLDEKETAVVRRGRNAHSNHAAPGHATRSDYADATAFEALLGYLYLTGGAGRAQTLYRLTAVRE